MSVVVLFMMILYDFEILILSIFRSRAYTVLDFIHFTDVLLNDLIIDYYSEATIIMMRVENKMSENVAGESGRRLVGWGGLQQLFFPGLC